MLGVAILFAVATCASLASLYFVYRLKKRIFTTYDPLLLRGLRVVANLENALEALNEAKSDVNRRKVLYDELIKSQEKKIKEVDEERSNVLNCAESHVCSVTRRDGESLLNAKKRLASKLGYVLLNEFPIFEEESSLTINVETLDVKKAFGDAIEECKCEGKE